jgi:hypothetical protein
MANTEYGIDLDLCLSLPFGPRRAAVNHFPSCAAVYLIYWPPDTVLYIGATICLRNRCRQHGSVFAKIRGIRVAWFPLPRKLHHETERRLIELIKPVLNTQYIPKDVEQTRRRVYYNAKAVRNFLKSQAKKNGNKKAGK